MSPDYVPAVEDDESTAPPGIIQIALASTMPA